MDSEEFKNVKVPEELILSNNTNLLDITPEKWKELVEEMNNPVEVQKEVAAKMKLFVDHQMRQDIKEYGKLTESTRKYLNDYTTLLSDLHKNLHGSKLNTEINIVSHAQISAKIRQASRIIDTKSEEK